MIFIYFVFFTNIKYIFINAIQRPIAKPTPDPTPVNSIENYFSMLKSRIQKLYGLKYENLKENIQKVINEIPKEKYENIFKGAYERPEKYVPKNKTRKVKKNYK